MIQRFWNRLLIDRLEVAKALVQGEGIDPELLAQEFLRLDDRWVAGRFDLVGSGHDVLVSIAPARLFRLTTRW